MIKYGVLIEYNCIHCNEKIEAGMDIPTLELYKLARELIHNSTCIHEWKSNEKESGSIRTECSSG